MAILVMIGTLLYCINKLHEVIVSDTIHKYGWLLLLNHSDIAILEDDSTQQEDHRAWWVMTSNLQCAVSLRDTEHSHCIYTEP